jgi:hypothetical protein
MLSTEGEREWLLEAKGKENRKLGILESGALTLLLRLKGTVR